MNDIRYHLMNDDDGHWYLVPADCVADFEEWVEYVEDVGDDEDFDEAEPPKGCIRIGGSPHQISFTNPEIDGVPVEKL